MAARKKNKQRRSKARGARIPAEVGESPRSVAATVAWMLAALATALGVGTAALTGWLAHTFPGGMWQAVSRYLLVTSCLTGVVALVLIPVVRAVRPERPPVVVERWVIGIALIPWLWMAWLVWQSSRAA